MFFFYLLSCVKPLLFIYNYYEMFICIQNIIMKEEENL